MTNETKMTKTYTYRTMEDALKVWKDGKLNAARINGAVCISTGRRIRDEYADQGNCGVEVRATFRLATPEEIATLERGAAKRAAARNA